MGINTMSDADLREAIRFWMENEREYYQDAQQMELRRYNNNRAKINKKYLSVLDDAIASGYLNIHNVPTRATFPLRRAYEGYCGAHGLPIVLIKPGRKKHLASITLNLESLNPSGQYGLYTPSLDPQEEPFHTFLLLAVDFTWSNGTSGHINLKTVHLAKAKEVAQRLLELYTTQYQKHRQRIDALVADKQMDLSDDSLV